MSLEQEMTRRRLLRGAGLLAFVGIAAPVTARLATAEDANSGTDGADNTGADGNGGSGTGDGTCTRRGHMRIRPRNWEPGT